MARSTLIREIPVHVGCRFSLPAHARPQGGNCAAIRPFVVRRDEQVSTLTSTNRVPGAGVRHLSRSVGTGAKRSVRSSYPG